MPDTKITALTAITTVDPAVDVLPIVDVSDTTMAASGTTKKITSNQILGAGGTATLASATIIGNLTVRTNALTVDANNNVGIGTTAPTVYTNYRTLAIVGGSAGGVIDINPSGGVTAGGLQIGSTAAATNIDAFGPSAGTAAPLVLRTGTFGSVAERYRVAGDGVATWSNVGGVAGTAMTLNSTGLGVGVVPSSYRFEVGSGSTDTRALFTSNNAFSIGVKNGANQLGGWIGSAGNNILTFSGNDGTMKVTIDNTGNVGVGVTTFGTSAARVLSIATGTEPTTGPTGTVQWFTSTRSANNTIPAIFTEGSGVTNAAITNVTVTNKIALKVNGTIYYLLATTSAA